MEKSCATSIAEFFSNASVALQLFLRYDAIEIFICFSKICVRWWLLSWTPEVTFNVSLLYKYIFWFHCLCFLVVFINLSMVRCLILPVMGVGNFRFQYFFGPTKWFRGWVLVQCQVPYTKSSKLWVWPWYLTWWLVLISKFILLTWIDMKILGDSYNSCQMKYAVIAYYRS